MRIGEADTSTKKGAHLNHLSYFADLRNAHPRQKVQPGKRFQALTERAQGQFRNDERMDRDIPRFELTAHRAVPGAEVVNPNGSVGKDHSVSQSLFETPARNMFQFRHRPAQCRQPACAFPLDQGPQSLSNERRFLHNPSELLRGINQVVVKRKCCSHRISKH